ncbi:hypothetical protein ACAG24_007875 [Mycobacterium sp. pW049]|uniref:hypothetical protein n=1 Tax=[Mycobacterium] bulgaricum TaxID=3238985 RepID=UPI00351B3DA5
MRLTRVRVLAVLAVPAALTASPAHAAPLPEVCAPAAVVDGVCTSRLVSVTADTVNGTITGTPVGGGPAITLAGPADAYRKSEGFGPTPPEPIRNWDTSIEQTAGLSTDPSDPNWYGNAKAKVFLSRTLNGLATQFPPDSLVVGFASDEAQPGVFRLVSIQPVAQ